MIIYEFRITHPQELDEHHVARLYSLATASLLESGGGEGIEIVVNEEFEGQIPIAEMSPGHSISDVCKGQYTHKIIHLSSKVPGFIRILAPKGSLEVTEQSWNAYPYCITHISNPYMKDSFFLEIKTIHKADKGETENIHQLTPEELEVRKVIVIDIVNDTIDPTDYRPEWDPTKIKSVKTGRGPLTESWKESTEGSFMTCYKLVTVNFKWFGQQNRVESIIIRAIERLLRNFNRQLFCWTDDWVEMTLDDIREFEEKTKTDLDKKRISGEVTGTIVK